MQFTSGLGTHTVVQKDKLTSGYHGPLESVQYTSNLDNGSLVNLGANISRDLVAVSTPATATLGTAEVLLVASGETTYYAGQNLKDFYNPANQPALAYHLNVGDEFTMSTSGIDGGAAVAVGSYVVAQNNSTRPLAQVAQPTGVRFYGVIIDNPTIGLYRDPAVTIRVVAC